MSLVALCMIAGAYFGVNQSKVLVPYFLLENDNTLINNKVLTIEEKDENIKIELLLNKVMQEQKPYFDEELTLSKLATYLNITDKKLSNLLNQYIDTTFYNFVNTYRLEEFKRRIKDDSFKDYTIEGIANDCGFKSKASFYRLFKKKTGLSPSEYKKSLK
ncbi:MAG: helix-turn-helix domain-containing protein [Flavobacteriaceae bacterium]